jgi:dolichol-phosphate mannosyltransferase
MIRFVIPAYNEVANIPRLMAELAPRVRALGARVIVVDDGSTDGTREEIAAGRQDLDLTVVGHPRNRGVGAALETGLRAALAEADDDDAIVTLEADTTSNLADLPAMLACFDAGYDVVLASVHAPGGRIIGVARWRRLASGAVSLAFRAAGGPREVHTLSSLYRVYRAGALRRLAPEPGRPLVREPGFAASVELLLGLHDVGATVAEVATVNDWLTRAGASKMSLRSTLPAYGRLMASRLAWRPERSPLAREE